MSVTNLVSYIDKVNIAKGMDKTKLGEIAQGVIDRANEDLQTMHDWMDCVDEGVKLCKPEYRGKDTPWPGAANFKSTILTEAANTFGNRATVELMRDPKLVKASIIGAATIKNVIDKKASEISQWKSDLEALTAQLEQLKETGDPEASSLQEASSQIQAKIAENSAKIKEKKLQLRKKDERADRVAELMNWQVNTKMKEWRSDQKRMMYSLPNVGCIFKKTYYDEALGRCVSKQINYPDFIVNQRTTSLEECRSFTHIIPFNKSEVEARQKQGVWLDFDEDTNNIYHEEDSGDEGSNEKSQVERTSDNPNAFYEQYCWLDLDEDGIDEPYIVTVHVSSLRVVRIAARFDHDSIIVKFEDDLVGKIPPMSLIDAQLKRAARIQADADEFGIEADIPDAEDLTGFKIVRIDPQPILTKYGLIPSFDGTFLDVGYYYLIGSATLGVNKTTNDLLNAGTLANQQGGFLAKGFRKKNGPVQVRMGEFSATEVPADQLMTSIMPMPFKEPSPTLFQLNEKLEMTARSFAANVDEGGQLQANTAPTTALAIIQESLIQHTAHMSLIIDSMSHEFDIIYKLNRIYLDPDEYKEVVGDDEAVFSEDFNTDNLSVVCGANPEMSSRMQRMMLSEAEMTQVPMVIQAGGNPVPIIRNYYKRIGSDNLDEIFPNEAEMSPEEKAQMKQMQAAQEQANAMAKAQLEFTRLQTSLLQRDQDRKDQEFLVNSREAMAKIDKLLEEVTKVKSETILNLEKAETEEVKNAIGIYTARSDELTKAEESLKAAEEIDSE